MREDVAERVVVRVDGLAGLLLDEVEHAARDVDVADGERERVDHVGVEQVDLELLLDRAAVGEPAHDVLEHRLLGRLRIDAAELLLDLVDDRRVALGREHVDALAAQHALGHARVRRLGLGQLGERARADRAVRIGVHRGDEVIDRGVDLAVELVEDAELDVRDREVGLERRAPCRATCARRSFLSVARCRRADSTHASGSVRCLRELGERLLRVVRVRRLHRRVHEAEEVVALLVLRLCLRALLEAPARLLHLLVDRAHQAGLERRGVRDLRVVDRQLDRLARQLDDRALGQLVERAGAAARRRGLHDLARGGRASRPSRSASPPRKRRFASSNTSQYAVVLYGSSAIALSTETFMPLLSLCLRLQLGEREPRVGALRVRLRRLDEHVERLLVLLVAAIDRRRARATR